MLWVPPSAQEFQWRASSITGVRPVAGAYGTTITPGASNAKGSYTAVLALIERDAWAIAINFNSNAVSTAIRNTLVDIGVDPAGGSSYSVLIPDLLIGGASPYNIGAGGAWYYFPVRIRAGSNIAARAQVNNATAGTFRCNITVFGSPKDRRTCRAGSFVRAIGVVSASSQGATVTPGTTSEGAWTSLGSVSDEKLWWWQMGMGVEDASMSALVYHADLSLGSASAKKLVIEDVNVMTTGTEQISVNPMSPMNVEGVNGDNVYARLQCSGTSDAGTSIAAYGVGG